MARGNYVIALPTQSWTPKGGGMPPSVVGKLPKSLPTSMVVPSCPKRTTKRSDVFKERNWALEERRHVKNSPLSEIEASKGARESSRNVGRKRLGMQWILLMISYLFIMYIVYSFLQHYEDLFWDGKDVWIKNMWWDSTTRKYWLKAVVAKRRMAPMSLVVLNPESLVRRWSD